MTVSIGCAEHADLSPSSSNHTALGRKDECQDENDQIFLSATEAEDDYPRGRYPEVGRTGHELIYSLDLEIEEFRGRLLSVLNLSVDRPTHGGCIDRENVAYDLPAAEETDCSTTESQQDQEHFGREPPFFLDPMYGANTPDSGLESSLPDSGEPSTPISSQSSCQHIAKPDGYMYCMDAEHGDSDLQLSHCLIHLLTLACSVSLVLQRSEYNV